MGIAASAEQAEQAAVPLDDEYYLLSRWQRSFVDGDAAILAIGQRVAEDVLAVLDDAYGHRVSEVGYETEGHTCLTEADLLLARATQSSLLYGEVLPHGVVKMLDEEHLRAGGARRLFDLGSGTGKLCMQAFLTYPNLLEVLGIELAPSRFAVAEAAARRLVAGSGRRFRIHEWAMGKEIAVCEEILPQYLPTAKEREADARGREKAAAALEFVPSKVAAPPPSYPPPPGMSGGGVGGGGSTGMGKGGAELRRPSAAGRSRGSAGAAGAGGGDELEAADCGSGGGGQGQPLKPAFAAASADCGGSCASRGDASRCRVLRFVCGNLFSLPPARVRRADCVVMETDLPEAAQARLCRFLCELRPGARLLTYLNLLAIWPREAHPLHVACPLRQAAANVPSGDRFATSWAFSSGHHLYMYKVTADSARGLRATAAAAAAAEAATAAVAACSSPPAALSAAAARRVGPALQPLPRAGPLPRPVGGPARESSLRSSSSGGGLDLAAAAPSEGGGGGHHRPCAATLRTRRASATSVVSTASSSSSSSSSEAFAASSSSSSSPPLEPAAAVGSTPHRLLRRRSNASVVSVTAAMPEPLPHPAPPQSSRRHSLGGPPPPRVTPTPLIDAAAPASAAPCLEGQRASAASIEGSPSLPRPSLRLLLSPLLPHPHARMHDFLAPPPAFRTAQQHAMAARDPPLRLAQLPPPAASAGASAGASRSSGSGSSSNLAVVAAAAARAARRRGSIAVPRGAPRGAPPAAGCSSRTSAVQHRPPPPPPSVPSRSQHQQQHQLLPRHRREAAPAASVSVAPPPPGAPPPPLSPRQPQAPPGQPPGAASSSRRSSVGAMLLLAQPAAALTLHPHSPPQQQQHPQQQQQQRVRQVRVDRESVFQCSGHDLVVDERGQVVGVRIGGGGGGGVGSGSQGAPPPDASGGGGAAGRGRGSLLLASSASASPATLNCAHRIVPVSAVASALRETAAACSAGDSGSECTTSESDDDDEGDASSSDDSCGGGPAATPHRRSAWKVFRSGMRKALGIEKANKPAQ